MAKKQEKDEGEQKVKVDGTVVKVKTLPPSKVRPAYYSETCDICLLLPSQLDIWKSIERLTMPRRYLQLHK
ncbi:hypothetical protein Ngar_c26020 [Candidatus Nitrososphaera gargensis Ga9.2]|uniref:Uncharacterized protein n=1 Tax=Nitrososphaera gargensis (strain Ga9.2) TaxID=1237085 RepID=K0INK3_NITGG|nr:hypothetical protein Ngar_c26020 [Candidatus Nitrososphaera gargensis Ga9.2]